MIIGGTMTELLMSGGRITNRRILSQMVKKYIKVRKIKVQVIKQLVVLIQILWT